MKLSETCYFIIFYTATSSSEMSSPDSIRHHHQQQPTVVVARPPSPTHSLKSFDTISIFGDDQSVLHAPYVMQPLNHQSVDVQNGRTTLCLKPHFILFECV